MHERRRRAQAMFPRRTSVRIVRIVVPITTRDDQRGSSPRSMLRDASIERKTLAHMHCTRWKHIRVVPRSMTASVAENTAMSPSSPRTTRILSSMMIPSASHQPRRTSTLSSGDIRRLRDDTGDSETRKRNYSHNAGESSPGKKSD